MYYSDSDGIKGFGMGVEGGPFGTSETALLTGMLSVTEDHIYTVHLGVGQKWKQSRKNLHMNHTISLHFLSLTTNYVKRLSGLVV